MGLDLEHQLLRLHKAHSMRLDHVQQMQRLHKACLMRLGRVHQLQFLHKPNTFSRSLAIGRIKV
ncbi:hypothetical protein SADUNF_Sadunf10G0028800 [Salix dunnii]|uniref:Uncharacterized protein n=1 Tax=Salix dunnii TaxID=1413687 RepID=A0A835JQ11_9ROSI|nr:hypothetical protein SADUNF_Sadunf10G0028800 [Salix dunnii]